MPAPQPLDLWHILSRRNNPFENWCRIRGITTVSQFLAVKQQIEAEGEYYLSQDMVNLANMLLVNDVVPPAPRMPPAQKDSPKSKSKKVGSLENPTTVVSVEGKVDTQSTTDTVKGDSSNNEQNKDSQ